MTDTLTNSHTGRQTQCLLAHADTQFKHKQREVHSQICTKTDRQTVCTHTQTHTHSHTHTSAAHSSHRAANTRHAFYVGWGCNLPTMHASVCEEQQPREEEGGTVGGWREGGFRGTHTHLRHALKTKQLTLPAEVMNPFTDVDTHTHTNT